MEKEMFEILKKVQNGEQSIGEAQSQLLLLFNVSGLLFLELAVRCQIELPLHEDELRWWDEETNVYQCGDFTSRFEDEIARVRKNNNR
jgi:hypothetical protein